ncbi:MAG: hypothetical protein ACI9MR_003576, partial [Myxococcota bacterium]
MGLMSMTGFGAGPLALGRRLYQIEVRSVNHRATSMRCQLPSELHAVDNAVSKHVRKRLGRGAIDLSVRLESNDAEPDEVVIDTAGAKALYTALKELATACGAPEPTLELVLRHGDFVSSRRPTPKFEGDGAEVLAAVDLALDALVVMRVAEGVALATDMLARLAHVEALVIQVEAGSAEVMVHQERRLRARLEKLRAELGVSVDEARLATELVMWSDKTDVTEETVRAHTHIARFRTVI